MLPSATERNFQPVAALLWSREDSAEPAPPAERRSLGPLLWGSAGFLVGAAFWHFIGFWHFVSLIVVGAPEVDTDLATPAARAIGWVAAQRGAEFHESQSCVALVRDPSTARTRSAPCAGPAEQLRHVTPSGRGDLAAASAR